MIASISLKARCSTVHKVLFSAEPWLLGLTPCFHVSSRQHCIPTIVRWTSPARRFTRPCSNSDTPSSGSNRDRLDPTAKRPTTKCDPYGLSGQSLSYTECHNLLGTLEDGWRLMYATDMPQTLGNAQVKEESDTTNSPYSLMTPSFLQKQFYHDTFYDASRFLSHVSLLATNINHYPYLSMERVLVDDLNQFQNSIRERNDHGGYDDDDDNGGSGIKKRRRKIKGWVFVSTVRCSTYRPSTKNNSAGNIQNTGSRDMYNDKGLTYHDFHLAMSIDVEASREELKRFLLKYVN